MAKKKIKEGYQPKSGAAKNVGFQTASSAQVKPPKGGTGEVTKKDGKRS